MKKRCLAFLLALCMVMTLLPAAALAVEPTSGTCGKDVIWTLENGILTISGSGPMEHFNMHPTYISCPWSSQCDAITAVVISQGVTNIGTSAFQGCTNLTSVTIPNSVTSINRWAFSNCVNLISVTIPNSVTDIDTAAFLGTGLTNVSIPNSVTVIGSDVFCGCTNLTSVIIPKSVSDIGDGAFNECSSLTDVYYSGSKGEWQKINIRNYSGDNEPLLNATIHCNESTSFQPQNPQTNTISSQDFVIENGVLTKYQGFDGVVTIPEGTTSIGYYAFAECSSISSVTIPDSVTTIQERAFFGCKGLTSVTIPDSVHRIEKLAFQGCTKLTSVTIGNSVGYIGPQAFSGCQSLTSVTIPDSVTDIGKYAFWGCTSLSSVTIGSGMKYIDQSAFQDCKSLTSIVIPNNVTMIVNGAFYRCTSLTSVTIPNSVTHIGTYAFGSCNLKDIYYGGTETQWKAIDIRELGNERLNSATIHYIGTGQGEADDVGQDTDDIGQEDYSDRSITFRLDSHSVPVGGKLLIGANLSDANNLSASDITWSSSNESVAVVEPDSFFETMSYASATVKGISFGSAKITIRLPDGRTASCDITVTEKTNEMDQSSTDIMLVGSDTELFVTLKVNTVYSDEGFEWSTSDSNVVAFDKNGADHISHSLNNWRVQDKISDSVQVFARAPGTATITCKSKSGAKAEWEIKVYSESGKKLQKLASDWVSAYWQYINAVYDSLQESKKGSLTTNVEEMAKKLQAADKKSRDKAVTLDASFAQDPEKSLNVYRAVARLLAEEAESEFSFSDIDVSGTNKDEYYTMVSVAVVDKVYESIETRSKKYEVGNATVSFSGMSGGYGRAQAIYYQETGKSSILVGHFGSKTAETKKLLKDLLKDLFKLEDKLVQQARKDMEKAILGKSLDELIKAGVKGKITNMLDNHLTAFQQSKAGDVATVVGNCIDYYKYVQKIVDLADSDPSEIFLGLSDMRKLDFKPDSNIVKNKAVKLAMNTLNSSADSLYKALVQYEKTGSINWTATLGDWWSNVTSGIKSIIACPVNVTVYSENGTKIGYVGDDDMWFNEDVLYIQLAGETKIIYSRDSAVKFDIIGTDYGTLNCTFEEYQDNEPVGRINYYDIPLCEGKRIDAAVPQSGITKNNTVVTVDGTKIPADDQIPFDNYGGTNSEVTITCKVNETNAGKVFGAGNYVPGDSVSLLAVAEDGYKFVGWFNESDALVSISNVYGFTATEDVTLTAYFTGEITFTDVPANAWYHDAVYWAVEKGITTGTSATTFTPDRVCTETEILTFLWRAAGKPASSAQLPFTVNASLKFAEAPLRWAYEKGMIDGSYNQTAPCTRATAVKFIWQAAGCPATAVANSFTDIPTGAVYAQAVAWAVDRGITAGTTSITFSPDKTCTRAEIVTFLHRAYK